MLVTKTVNKCRVNRIPQEGEGDKRPTKGFELCPHLYANIYLVAMKNSGKTTLIYNIINRCAGRNTKVIAFVSTFHNDVNWRMIEKKLEEKGIPLQAFTSLLNEEKVDQLATLMKIWQAPEEEGGGPAEAPKMVSFAIPEDAPKRERKLPYQSPEYIIVLDDLADDLKKKSVETLLKKNRHFKCKVIISSQWLNDIPPSALGQMSIVIMLRGFSEPKLAEFHSKARLSIPIEKFVEMYKDATSVPYGFLYIDLEHHKFRSKFDAQYEL